MGAAVFEQSRTIGGPALGVAQRIDLELQFQLQLLTQLIDHDQQFGVASRVGATENLDAKLMELPEAPLLRPLAAKHRTRVIETLLGIAAIQARLDIGADDTGSPFRSNREQRLRLVGVAECVHLLFDDIRGFAARTLIQFEPFEDRDAHLVDRVALHDRARAVLDPAHGARARPDQILKTSETCQVQISLTQIKRAARRAAPHALRESSIIPSGY